MLGIRNRDPAQHDGGARSEAVYVEAESGARFHGQRDEIVRGSDLAVILAARNHDNLQACALRDGRIVGQCRRLAGGERGSRAMRGKQWREAEDLRGLCPPQMLARHGLGDGIAVADTFQGVGQRDAEDGAIGSLGGSGGNARLDLGNSHERPGSIVNRHEVRGIAAQRFEPVQDRLLTAGPSMDGRRQGETVGGCDIVSVISRTDNDLDPIHAGGLECANRPAQDRLAVEKRILLGQRTAEAAAAAGRDDQGGHFTHNAQSSRLSPRRTASPCAGRRDPLLLA